MSYGIWWTCQFTEKEMAALPPVYMKPTHTDQYLAYDSHHPKSVKRGIVKCLYDRAKRVVTNYQSPLERRNTCHLYLFFTDIPPVLCRKSQRQKQAQEESPWQSLNPPPFYLMAKEYRSLSAAAWNNKAFASFSSLTRHFDYSYCDQRTPSTWLNKVA